MSFEADKHSWASFSVDIAESEHSSPEPERRSWLGRLRTRRGVALTAASAVVLVGGGVFAHATWQSTAPSCAVGASGVEAVLVVSGPFVQSACTTLADQMSGLPIKISQVPAGDTALCSGFYGPSDTEYTVWDNADDANGQAMCARMTQLGLQAD